MNRIEEVIKGFSKQELREFKYFTGKGSSKTTRKDFELLDTIRAGENHVGKGENAHHQTLKRLKFKLEQFALLENKRRLPSSQIPIYLEVSRYFSQKAHYGHAWNYLQKAEQVAKEQEEYELLDHVYHAEIDFLIGTPYANIPTISIPDLLQKREANQKLSQIDGNANAAYALLIHEVKEKFSKGLHHEIDDLVENILRKYLPEDALDDYPRIYSRIVITLCRALREKKDYRNLALYSLSSYRNLVKRNLIAKISPDILMELIRAIYQSSIRTSDFITSEKFQKIFKTKCEIFKSQSEKYIYYDFRANVMAADIYMCTNRLENAQETLFRLKDKYETYKQSSIVFIFLRINLMALHFKLNEFSQCEKLYKTIIRQDENIILKEEGMGLEIMLLSEIYGCLIYYELNDPEEADYLLKRIRKKYTRLFKREEGKRELLFLKILDKLINNPSYINEKKFRSDVDRFKAIKKFTPADKEYISLNAWLQSRIEKSGYYSCFLKEIES